MTFDEILTQVLDLLQREKRVSYRALKRRFDLDDDYLEDVKDELFHAKNWRWMRRIASSCGLAKLGKHQDQSPFLLHLHKRK